MPPWIERVVQRVAPLAGWEDLKLSDDALSTMKRIQADMQERIDDSRSKNGSKNKGKPRSGVVAVFNGPQSPHKITAAEVLAKELQMNLYRVDLSLVVSPTLEETERIMKRIIDGAETAGGVLFFDQAELLFERDEDGTDVDKGIGYLVKRAGRYEDLAVIAVPDKDQMDLVHLRKLHNVVDFGA
ncbi:MAG TPA: AAA family ATPase [Actinomycetota bacterium]|jgi:SpoVK/Ycf46/Vps4 family AAA+-type ATPase|nr:AAA family ATPase [Actinomycetota bacterium]